MTCVAMADPQFGEPSVRTMARKTSSRVGCFSTYSTVAGGRSCLELGERPVRDDPALVEDRDPVGELLGLVQVLGGEQHSRAAAGELLDAAPHLEAGLGVQPGGRLVEEDHGRIADEAHGDVQAAPHAAGVGGHATAGRIRQLEAVQQIVGYAAGVLLVPQARHQHEVLAAGEDLVDRGELAGQADRLAHVRGLRDDVEARDRCGPRVGPEQRGQDADHRGLARAVGAEQGEDAAP